MCPRQNLPAAKVVSAFPHLVNFGALNFHLTLTDSADLTLIAVSMALVLNPWAHSTYSDQAATLAISF